ncbi:penicillin acylase family protein [Shewanella sp. Choline-02u-19]|uniref:penicillin acylase family protein n=1 Tax=unclassified Shewanella TaxID=196818 RepID=UPI000C33AFD4|nr:MULTISPECIES: penicillin acylase family protein [unclassified Shewanella]PKH54900.1 penicillin acylase family protein [Shewanella sp. Bg11-22]PKI26672.1 penicillin acylase family protein [Shewanella sp. Choline-02u-19]
MKKIIKITAVSLLSIVFIAAVGVYLLLFMSLPKLDASIESDAVSDNVSIERDRLGTAVVTASHRQDAAYGLGYAHGQDRFFQMDLLRRNSAGELSEIFGEKALELDKRHRFHQLRKRANNILKTLPEAHIKTLTTYARGVNDAVAAQSMNAFEYLVTGANPRPWEPADSLLVIYSMYLDLQGNTIKRDLTLTHIQSMFGAEMVAFIIQPSQYQAPLDGSLISLAPPSIPQLSPLYISQALPKEIAEPLDIGSNNWAVTGELTQNGNAMLSDDMHLSFAVPIIWYRAQLNYQHNGEDISITGVSLPGAPAIVVGSNGHVAWGFTNAYIDTADWIEIDDDTELTFEDEEIRLPDSAVDYKIPMSRFGPVKQVSEKRYALSWVGHQDYAVDMSLVELDSIKDVQQGIAIASNMGIPVQNMMLVDTAGNAAWKPAGAFPSRTNPSEVAIAESDYQADNWLIDQVALPEVINPDTHRLWSGNSRVVSTKQHKELGNGGYALGARSTQIRDRLFAGKDFTVDDFYQLQLDNEARFLQPWQQQLITVLSTKPQRFAKDIVYLNNWKACACSDSVGYTLVRQYRQQLIDTTFAPLETQLALSSLSLSPVKRDLEPAMWQLINAQPKFWLPTKYTSWSEYMLNVYQESKQQLLAKHSQDDNMDDLAWGSVNELKIQHPFSKQIPILSTLLDMPTVTGFGDSYMPAVQGASFGASQRFIVQPGDEANGVLAIPGGQSGHPLSDFYRAGFTEYAAQQQTPLLPSRRLHRIEINAKEVSIN